MNIAPDLTPAPAGALSNSATSRFFLVPGPILERHVAAARLAPPNDCTCLERLASLHRIDTLAGLKAAGHGWLGASFSAMELLTVIYHRHIAPLAPAEGGRNALILSKGHAVMSQYAILAALGAFPRDWLLQYKAAGGLPAHCDRTVPGVDADSGSLGQGLSKGIGLCLANKAAGRDQRVFVVLGDGEMQEGQVFESLLTLQRLNLRGCLPIIDRNFLQSDSPTAQVKDAEDWGTVLRGIGYLPFSIDGHDVPAILAALKGRNEGPRPLAIIAQTRKGFGTSLTTMAPDTPRGQGIWHGRIPDDPEYLAMLAELVERVGDAELETASQEFIRRLTGGKAGTATAPGPARPESPDLSSGAAAANDAPADPAAAVSTGDGFGAALVEQGSRIPGFRVLDADLEKACRLSSFAGTFPERFHEIGISEQDMTSIAAGLGLGGQIAVVNTYGSFFKRCLDQVFAVAAEGLPVIFAGHYAGVDYFTDGKSHQSLNDLGLMRALGGIEIFEPLTPGEAGQILAHLLDRLEAEIKAGRPSKPAYVRLHRSPVTGLPPLPHGFAHGQAYVFSALGGPARATLFAASPQFLAMACDLQKLLAEQGQAIEVVGVSSYTVSTGNLASLARSARLPITLESHLTEGGLADLVAPHCGRPPLRLGATGPTGSTRTFRDMLAAHHLEPGTILERIRQALG